MAHYTIRAFENTPVDVRQGTAYKKKTVFSKHWPWIKVNTEKRTAYIVTIEAFPKNNKKQYHLLRTKDENWPATNEDLNLAIKIQGKWQPIKDDQITLAIKKAIDNYENKQ